jgi:predicted TIM-barrel fold metal-dependent hydrolase
MMRRIWDFLHHDPHQAVGALFSAHLSDEQVHDICHRNAEKLLAPFL